METRNATLRTNVIVLGLDGLVPELVFDRYLGVLPNFRSLIATGVWGELLSVDPPITVPAWTCMMTGHSPRQLGIYGFRHRPLGTYDKQYAINSTHLKVPRVWEILSEHDYNVGVVGVPQTYPLSTLKGFAIADFLCPDGRAQVFPNDLSAEIASVTGPYQPDVEGFRVLGRDAAVTQVRDLTVQHFALFSHLLRTRPSHFAMMVELGPDRVHHLLFRHADPKHPLHDSSSTRLDPVREYYRLLDAQVGRILSLLPESTHVFVVSDHGAKSMQGGFCINDWLISEKWLCLKRPARSLRRFDAELVDWTHTRAWAWGGHYARVFLNLEGREPCGIVPASQYQATLDELCRSLGQVTGVDQRPMNNRCLRPADPSDSEPPAGDYPDLIVYLGNLDWRALGTVGNAGLFARDNDTGPDDANHDFQGVFLYRGPRTTRAGHRPGLRLVDVAPTLLDLFGLQPCTGAIGHVIPL